MADFIKGKGQKVVKISNSFRFAFLEDKSLG